MLIQLLKWKSFRHKIEGYFPKVLICWVFFWLLGVNRKQEKKEKHRKKYIIFPYKDLETLRGEMTL